MATPGERHTRRALSAGRGRLQKAALKLVGWLAIGYLISAAAAGTQAGAAWAQLGAGIVVPGGALANLRVGVWILRRFGMPVRTIAERQFNLSFFKTWVDAVALGLLGSGLGGGVLGVGVRGSEHEPLLTIVPAACAASGGTVVVLVARGAD